MGNIYCTIAYENLEDLISGIQRLDKKAALDSINQEDDVKNIVMTPSGFVIGYYMNKGKVKRFFGFGHEPSNREDINRDFSTYEENFDTFNSERETYGIFYWRIFGVRKYANFLSTLQDEFKAQLEFLTELGIKELAKDDEILCEESFKSDSVRLNCRSYHKNGHLKFAYTFENAQEPYLDNGVETFELFMRMLSLSLDSGMKQTRLMVRQEVIRFSITMGN